jgi:hypothetical protein
MLASMAKLITDIAANRIAISDGHTTLPRRWVLRCRQI